MKLELKHLAPYLPYNLKTNEGWVIGLSINEVITKEIGYEIPYDYSDIEPILRPLSDLIKEIEIDGKKVKICDLLEIDSCVVEFINFKRNTLFHNQPIIRPVECEFIYATDVYNNITQKIFEYHFDIFGLIEQGLAVDINTIK